MQLTDGELSLIKYLNGVLDPLTPEALAALGYSVSTVISCVQKDLITFLPGQGYLLSGKGEDEIDARLPANIDWV